MDSKQFSLAIFIGLLSYSFGSQSLYFVTEPSDTYLLKDHSTLLHCKAKHALRLNFICSTDFGTEHIEEHFVEPESGDRYTEGYLDISPNDTGKIEENEITCFCQASSSSEIITSRKARIRLAYLGKEFILDPEDAIGMQSYSLTLLCEPPMGNPDPEVSWIKNGHPLAIDGKRMTVSSTGNLVFHLLAMSDRGMYSCQAKNIAGTVLSKEAELEIVADGSWSAWSAWSSCSVSCGKGFRRRTRGCTDLDTSNCPGKNFQQNSCSYQCQVIHGEWSLWSSWSTCNDKCQKHKYRTCTNPPPLYGGDYCQGSDFVVSNCTDGDCPEQSVFINSTDSNAIIIIAVIIVSLLLLTFGLLSILGFRVYGLNKIWNKALEKGSTQGEKLALFERTLLSDYEKPELKVWAKTSPNGGRLILDDCQIELIYYPTQIERDIFITLATQDRLKPTLSEKETLLSAVVEIGTLENKPLVDPVVLELDNALASTENWILKIVGAEGNSSEWKRVYAVEKSIKPNCYAIHSGSSYFVVSNPGRYAIVGIPLQGASFNLAIFAFLSHCKTLVKVHFIPRLTYLIKDLLLNEERRGSIRLNEAVLQPIFHMNRTSLCLNLYNLAPGWSGGTYQELEFIPNGKTPTMCSFPVQSINPQEPFTGSLHFSEQAAGGVLISLADLKE